MGGTATLLNPGSGRLLAEFATTTNESDVANKVARLAAMANYSVGEIHDAKVLACVTVPVRETRALNSFFFFRY